MEVALWKYIYEFVYPTFFSELLITRRRKNNREHEHNDDNDNDQDDHNNLYIWSVWDRIQCHT